MACLTLPFALAALLFMVAFAFCAAAAVCR